VAVVAVVAASIVPGNQIKVSPVMLELPMAEPGKTRVVTVVAEVVAEVAIMVVLVELLLVVTVVLILEKTVTV
jgi:hypothetical protein